MTNICRCGTYQRIREALHQAADNGTDRASRGSGAPAALNAIHAATGKVVRSLPLKNVKLV